MLLIWRTAPGVRDLDLYGRANAVPCGQPGSRGDAHPGQNAKSPTPSGASSPNPRLKMKQKVASRNLCRSHHTMHWQGCINHTCASCIDGTLELATLLPAHNTLCAQQPVFAVIFQRTRQ